MILVIRKMLLMSVKPQHMRKILDGNKTIELRRTKPKISNGDLIVFYASSPQKAIQGAATVGNIIEGNPCQLWKDYHAQFGITMDEFNEYFSGSKKAFGSVLETVWIYNNPIGLLEIREVVDSFMPPRSFRYLSKEEYRMVSSLKKGKRAV